MWISIAPLKVSFDFVGCWNRAVALTGIKQESIARAMGDMSKGQLSRDVHADAKIALGRLLMAAENDADVAAFYQELHREISSALGWERDTPQTLLRRALSLLDRRVASVMPERQHAADRRTA